MPAASISSWDCWRLFIVIAFCAVMFHVTRMAFGARATGRRSAAIAAVVQGDAGRWPRSRSWSSASMCRRRCTPADRSGGSDGRLGLRHGDARSDRAPTVELARSLPRAVPRAGADESRRSSIAPRKICHIECCPRRPARNLRLAGRGPRLHFCHARSPKNGPTRVLTYVRFYQDDAAPWVDVEVALDACTRSCPRSAGSPMPRDWHEREVEDLFGLAFEGHPRLGDFILHEDWPEGREPDAPRL